MPFTPFGIFLKSFIPCAFCDRLNTAWSVPISCKPPPAKAPLTFCCWSSDLMGGLITYLDAICTLWSLEWRIWSDTNLQSNWCKSFRWQAASRWIDVHQWVRQHCIQACLSRPSAARNEWATLKSVLKAKLSEAAIPLEMASPMTRCPWALAAAICSLAPPLITCTIYKGTFKFLASMMARYVASSCNVQIACRWVIFFIWTS